MERGQSQIEFAYCSGEYTLIGLSSKIPSDWPGKKVIISDVVYDTSMVYDLPNHIAIKGVVVDKDASVKFI